jgi:hypothetical protein
VIQSTVYLDPRHRQFTRPSWRKHLLGRSGMTATRSPHHEHDPLWSWSNSASGHGGWSLIQSKCGTISTFTQSGVYRSSILATTLPVVAVDPAMIAQASALALFLQGISSASWILTVCIRTISAFVLGLCWQKPFKKWLPNSCTASSFTLYRQNLTSVSQRQRSLQHITPQARSSFRSSAAQPWHKHR